jgi:hypothetical protein
MVHLNTAEARDLIGSGPPPKLSTMPGLFFLDTLQRRIRESKRQKRLTLAAAWPKTTAEINRWTILPAEETETSFSSAFKIEAGFHFILNGEYFGGYVRSTPISHTAAERAAHGNPNLTIRYNPTNPDQTVVLAQDNTGNLPFEVFST